jgi:hypothetical protein
MWMLFGANKLAGFLKGGDTLHIFALITIKKASLRRPIYSNIHTLSVNLF